MSEKRTVLLLARKQSPPGWGEGGDAGMANDVTRDGWDRRFWKVEWGRRAVRKGNCPPSCLSSPPPSWLGQTVTRAEKSLHTPGFPGRATRLPPLWRKETP